jgi:hypothetical protein
MYSSAPLSTELACAMQVLSRQGLTVVVRPLSELPTSPMRKQLLRLHDERNALRLQLATVGELLNAVENGMRVLSAGDEQGLRADRDSLRSRLRGVEAALKKQEAGEEAPG